MEINYLKTTNPYSAQNNGLKSRFNRGGSFKQTPTRQEKAHTSYISNITKEQKTALATGGGILAGIAGIAAAFRNRNFVNAFNKIFRPYKNSFLYGSKALKIKDFRKYHKERFSEEFTKMIQERAAGRKNTYPSDGIFVVGPDSKNKTDFFEWAVKEMENNGVEIIDPKPGASPKLDDVHDCWSRMFFDNGMTPGKAKEEFQKTGKFKALVIRDIDEMGVSKKYTNDSFEYAEEFLNDRPDTNYAAKKFGLIKMFSAKSDEPLSPATIRTGRIGWRMTPMPYDNEPAEVWKNYLDYTKDHYGSEYITQVIKYAKKLFKKRGGQDLKELTPHFKFQLPYAAAEFKDPLKKWQNWAEYMSTRKGVSDKRRMNDFKDVVEVLARHENTMSYPTKYKEIKESPKFKAITEMLFEKFSQIAKKYPEKYIKQHEDLIVSAKASIAGIEKIIQDFQQRIKANPEKKEVFLNAIETQKKYLESKKQELAWLQNEGINVDRSIKAEWENHVARCLAGQVNSV